MDIAGILAATAGVAALARAANKKGKGRGDRSSHLRSRLLKRGRGSTSLSELLSGRLLVRTTGMAGRGSGSSGAASGRSGAARPHATGPRRVPGSRGGGATSTARVRRRPDRAELEREGVPHPLIIRRRRDRRRELLREVANVAMGSAAIGVSTAGLLFDAGVVSEWWLGGGALAAAVFGWILGRGVLSDLIHLGA
ncbi:MAG: hypothetical protein Q8W51_09890 [Candidatus Palauibacterales bacterium]|nr:hypothetical protein [Candidatus Palauibacterales bacterium]MDP2530040.1 hypothetical protein [Candidatus Palauibacterales bacterium]MDP2582832.1 hypothetical protein [Candidatus Palauibacterales bacterium]